MNLDKISKKFVIGAGMELAKGLNTSSIKSLLPSPTQPVMDDQRNWSLQRRKTMACGEGL